MTIFIIGEGIVEDMIQILVNDGNSIDEMVIVNKNALDKECKLDNNMTVIDIVSFEQYSDRVEVRTKIGESVTLIVIPMHRVVSIIYHYGKKVKCNESDNIQN